MIRSVILAGALVAAAPAFADCDHFKWSVAKEREAFASPQPLASISDSAKVGQGYALTLSQGLDLPNKPERDPKPGKFEAVIRLNTIDAGLYQVTLSQDAWVGVAQGDKVVKSSDFSGQHDCPTVRKSVRFQLGAGPATVEIVNADASALNFAVVPAP
jgi:hypothetical protein